MTSGPIARPTGGKPQPLTTLTGAVTRSNVEGNCLLLTVEGGSRYVLVGATTAIVPGATVTVRGRVERAFATTSQAGPAYVVESVVAAPP